jgi:two-component system, cell cycle sensor histidine kinase and response regulator CckA
MRATIDRLPDPASLPYDEIFTSSASGMAVAHLDGRLLAVNPALCRMLRMRAEELLGRTFLEVTHPEDREGNQHLYDALLADEIPSFTVEKRYLTGTGTPVWGRVSCGLLRRPDGSGRYVIATVEDITEHRQAERQLELSESLRRAAGRMARVGGWALELATEEVSWSDEMFDILEVPDEATPALLDGHALYTPADRERLEAAIAACAADGTPFDLELGCTTFAGRPLAARVVGRAERAADGTIVRLVGAFQDVSELHAAQTSAREIADRLTTALESMTDAVYLLDRDWRFTYLNERAAQLLGRDRGELVGRVLWEEFPELVDTATHAAFRRAEQQGRAVRLEDLSHLMQETWFAFIIYPSEQGYAVYFRDVTDQHRARTALAEHESRLAEQAALLNETQEAIYVQGLDGVVTYVNRSAERIYDCQAEDAVGRLAADITAGAPEAHAAAMQATVARGTWVGELTHTGADGIERTLQSRWTLLRDPDGAPRSVLVTDTDVTESRRIEQQLISAQRMESIGTLAGGIAHDLNNVLAPITMAIGLLAGSVTDERSLELLRAIEGNAQRGAAMLRQVLAFARGVGGERAELQVAEVVAEVLRLAADTFPRNIRLATDLQPGLGPVLGDETQLHQVLMNLIVNARDALPDGGTITCRASDEVLDDQSAATPPGLEPGRYVLLEVIDDGHGMPPEVAARVFEPFFTTKAPGEGTGLGLPTSFAIVRSHAGHIEVASEPGRGTRFRVYLPAVEASTSPASPVPTGLARPGHGEVVLVVDDDALIRSVTQNALELGGYRVITAADGTEAVAAYQARRTEISLVITDLMMPGMSGRAVITELRHIDPQVRIVIASGLTDDREPFETDLPVLPKPFTTDDLLREVADALATAAT